MAEYDRRYSDTLAMPKQRITRLAFLLAGLLIAVTSASLLFVGFVASRASTQQAIANEERLFRSTLSERLRSMVREQRGMTSSDSAVQHIVRDFDQDFVREKLRALWSDFGHGHSMVIGSDRKILAESFETYTHFSSHTVEDRPELVTILDNLEGLYRRNRVRIPGGFAYRSLEDLDPSEYAVMGFITTDSRVSLYAAMPVIPDENTVALPDGAPTVLYSERAIDPKLLRELNAQLSFSDFGFTLGAASPDIRPFHAISGQGGKPVGHFTWTSQARGTSIWPMVIPVVVGLSLALGALAFGIAFRIGQLTRSLQASERQNRYLALHDSLSGLANRLQFNRALENAVKGLPKRPFAIIHCDLDRFKAVNDTLGHAAGDTVIKVVARRLAGPVGPQGLVARIGGDEFVVLFHSHVDKDRLRHLCRELILEIEKPIPVLDGETAQVGLSIGVSIAPQDGRDEEELMTAADLALYHAKENGRGRLSFYCEMPKVRLEHWEQKDTLPPQAAWGAAGR